MPASSTEGKKWIVEKVSQLVNEKRVRASNILDVGVGNGTYIRLFSEESNILSNCNWIGIEVWEPYIDKYFLRQRYDHIINADVRNLDAWATDFTSYSIAFLGDVLEHMTKDEAKKVVEKVLAISEYVFISIPIVHYPQDAIEGNPYERHVKDDWSHEEVMETFSHITHACREGQIGVYMLRKPEKLKIAIYTIAKNEEKNAERWALNNKDADLRVVVDTGSTDNTVAILKDHGVVVHSATFNPWRFDVARNFALKMVPDDVDVCIWQDLDEMLSVGWREELESRWIKGEHTKGYHRFKHNTNPEIWHYKIHTRHGYVWKGPIHEQQIWTHIDKEESFVWLHNFRLTEYHKEKPERSDYIDLHLQAIEENPMYWKLDFFLANEYVKKGELDLAKEHYLKAAGKASTRHEKAYCYRTLAMIQEQDDLKTYFLCLSMSTTSTRETAFLLAQHNYNTKSWSNCVAFVEATLLHDNKPAYPDYTFLSNAWDNDDYLKDIGSVAAYYASIDAKNKGMTWLNDLLEKYPGDERILQNKKFLEAI